MEQLNPAAAGIFSARIRDTMARLGLTEDSTADYLGVPVFTLRKWIKGARCPTASAVRLLDVLGTLEALAPALHAAFLPAPRAPEPPRKRGRPKKLTTELGHAKKPGSKRSTDSVMQKNPV